MWCDFNSFTNLTKESPISGVTCLHYKDRFSYFASFAFQSGYWQVLGRFSPCNGFKLIFEVSILYKNQ